MMTRATLFLMLAGALAASSGPCPAAGPAGVEFVAAEDEVRVLIGGTHVTSYLHGAALTKPVLYPVSTLGGVALTRGYPLAKIEGETTDHPHHVGIFFTYDEVNDQGFWNNTTTPPQIRHVETKAMEGGAERGRLETLSRWIAKDGATVVLEESRAMVFQPLAGGYSIDIDIVLTAKTKVVFTDTKEGMFAIRTADWLREKNGTGKYTSSEGGTSSKEIWGRRARWVALEGDKEGAKVGIAIMHHPSSVNYPTYWHARDYGLFSANPLGQAAFQQGTGVADPTPLELTLEPGASARFRFLVVVYEGARTPAQLEAQFQAFAN